MLFVFLQRTRHNKRWTLTERKVIYLKNTRGKGALVGVFNIYKVAGCNFIIYFEFFVLADEKVTYFSLKTRKFKGMKTPIDMK